MKSRRILVTGASGTIGRALVALLTGQGHRVTAVSRHRQSELPCEAVLACDLVVDLPPPVVLGEIDIIVHLAGDGGGRGTSLAGLRRINVDAARRLAVAAAAAGVGRFVLVSSIKVHGEVSPPGSPFDEHSPLRPVTPYARSRLEAEQALAEVASSSVMEVVTARPVAVFGAAAEGHFATLSRWLRRGRLLPLSAGCSRSLLCLDSAASALALLATHATAAGRVFVVADPDPLQMAEIVALIARAQGHRCRTMVFPERPLSSIMRRFGSTGPLARLLLPLEADSAPLLRDLGWRPPVAVREALLRYAEQW